MCLLSPLVDVETTLADPFFDAEDRNCITAKYEQNCITKSWHNKIQYFPTPEARSRGPMEQHACSEDKRGREELSQQQR